jgi:hypothetical protein
MGDRDGSSRLYRKAGNGKKEAAGDGRTDLHRMAMRRASAQVGPPEEAPEELVFQSQFAVPSGAGDAKGTNPRRAAEDREPAPGLDHDWKRRLSW